MREPPTSDAGMTEAPKPAPQPVSDRWKIGIIVIAVLFVVMPFLFWRSTWFGLPLSDREMTENFADAEHPRKAQHALTQVGERMTSPDARVRESARRRYPQVVAAAQHPKEEIRLTAAWVMGQDNTAAEFREPLAKLLADEYPMVRYNAALALVRFGDAAGREQILAMLRPQIVKAAAAGMLAPRLQADDSVNPGTLLARIKVGEGEEEVRSPVSGRVARWLKNAGASVVPGDAILEIAPSAEMVWEGLRALALIGRPEDEIDVEFYLHPMPGMPLKIELQAKETIRSIKQRARAADGAVAPVPR